MSPPILDDRKRRRIGVGIKMEWTCNEEAPPRADALYASVRRGACRPARAGWTERCRAFEPRHQPGQAGGLCLAGGPAAPGNPPVPAPRGDGRLSLAGLGDMAAPTLALPHR